MLKELQWDLPIIYHFPKDGRDGNEEFSWISADSKWTNGLLNVLDLGSAAEKWRQWKPGSVLEITVKGSIWAKI